MKGNSSDLLCLNIRVLEYKTLLKNFKKYLISSLKRQLLLKIDLAGEKSLFVSINFWTINYSQPLHQQVLGVFWVFDSAVRPFTTVNCYENKKSFSESQEIGWEKVINLEVNRELNLGCQIMNSTANNWILWLWELLLFKVNEITIFEPLTIYYLMS